MKSPHDTPTQEQRVVGGMAPTHSQPHHKKQMGSQHDVPAALPRARPSTHCTRRWGGPGGSSRWHGKSHPTGNRSPDRLDCMESMTAYGLTAEEKLETVGESNGDTM